MPRARSSYVFVFTVLSASALLVAQTWPQTTQTRDVPPASTDLRFPVGSSTISGTVVVADTGRPVRGAQVEVEGLLAPAAEFPSSLSRTVYSDAYGQFSFPRLPAGQFTISVTHEKLLDVSYGQRRLNARGSIIQLADGQQISITVPMPRGAVITGSVVGPDGELGTHVAVHVSRCVMGDGFRRLQEVRATTTDDRGMYRVFGLEPGDYFIAATPDVDYRSETARQVSGTDGIERAIVSGRVLPPVRPGLPSTVAVPLAISVRERQVVPRFYLPIYASDSTLPSGATIVTVRAGEERMGVDIHLRLIQSGTVRGVVMTPLDIGVSVSVWLVGDDATIDTPEASWTFLRPDGTFSFQDVAPGSYRVLAQTVVKERSTYEVQNQHAVLIQPPLADAQKMWGSVPINVGSESVTDTSLWLQPTRSISGVVVFDMAQPPDLASAHLMVTVNPAPALQALHWGPRPQAPVGSDGRFTISGVAAGRLVLSVNGAGRLKSAIVSGQDTLDLPIEFTADRNVTDAVLTVTDKVSELNGILTDSAGKPAPDYTIVVMATDRRYWTPLSRRILAAEPGRDGRFAIQALPPGSYLMAVVTDIEDGAQYDPEFLRRLASTAVPVTLVEGAKVTQNLRVK